VRVSYPRLDGHWRAGLHRRLLDWTGLREIIVNVRIAFDPRDVRASRQCVGNLTCAFHQDGVNDIERLVLDVAVAQPLQDWLLCAPGLLQQGLIHEAALLHLSWQIGGRAQVGLVSEHDKKFSLLSVGCVFHHPGRDLVRDIDCVAANALADSSRRSDSSNGSHSSCNKEQRTKNTPPWRPASTKATAWLAIK
jgi:hypothetical protein